MRIDVVEPLPFLFVHQMHGSKWWLTLEDYALEMIIDEVKYRVVVPASYRYDRATIWWQVLITRDHLGCIGPLFHDALCRYDGDLPIIVECCPLNCEPAINPSRTFTRPEVDDIFKAVMLADHVVAWRAWVAWVFVKLVPNWRVER